MKKYIVAIFILGFVQICCAEDIIVNGSTTISQLCSMTGSTSPIADLNGRTLRFLDGASITGPGTIINGSIDANFYQIIFDPNLTLANLKPSRHYFSACWFGASSTNIDNYESLQRAINVCINQPIATPLYIPSGNYRFSRPLSISIELGQNEFSAVNFHMFGNSQFWSGLTQLVYTGVGNTYALSIQDGLGVEVNNLAIIGQYEPPGNSDTYFTTTTTNYTDQGDQCTDEYSGIVIDPEYSARGSSGVNIHDMKISNFAVDISVSPGKSEHSDMLTFENIQVADSKWGIRAGFSGSKGNIVQGLYSWGRMHTLICIGNSGRKEAGCWTFDGANIAGNCIRIFDITDAGWYPIKIKDFYSESIGSVGTIISKPPERANESFTGYTEPPIYIEGCTFDFFIPALNQTQISLRTSIDRVRFESCQFRYYANRFPGKTIFMVSDDPSLTLDNPLVYPGSVNQNAAFNNCSFEGYLYFNNINITSTPGTIPPNCTKPVSPYNPPFTCSQNPTIFLMN